MTKDELEDLPLGGFAGEFLTAGDASPPPQPQAVRIPPPPWSEHYDPWLDPDAGDEHEQAP